jgi:hypothetical protein
MSTPKTNRQESIHEYNSSVIYSAGYPFKYWPFSQRKKWFIPLKFANMKQELLRNSIFQLMNVHIFDKYLEIARKYLILNCVRKLKCNSNSKWILEFEIVAGSMITLSHLLSVLFYCNFTDLCTAFSATFRKLAANESDSELISRNSHFREWSRFLHETVLCFGSSFSDAHKHEQTFYHGINHAMLFNSTYARFYGPTSTTTSINMARIVAGDYVFIILSVVGLATIAETMTGLFIMIKYLGAAYLFWLGTQLLFPKNQESLQT